MRFFFEDTLSFLPASCDDDDDDDDFDATMEKKSARPTVFIKKKTNLP